MPWSGTWSWVMGHADHGSADWWVTWVTGHKMLPIVSSSPYYMIGGPFGASEVNYSSSTLPASANSPEEFSITDKTQSLSLHHWQCVIDGVSRTFVERLNVLLLSVIHTEQRLTEYRCKWHMSYERVDAVKPESKNLTIKVIISFVLCEHFY